MEHQYDERLARLRLLLGDDGLASLSNSRVMVLGLGGVGSSCAEALARGGVGALTVLDRDVVEPSNINRQRVAYWSTVGQSKAEVMARIIADINPDCDVLAQQVYLSPAEMPDYLNTLPTPDYVVDCIDTVTQKLVVAQWCAERGLRLLSSMGAANKLDPTQLGFADIFQTKHCPLATAIRKQCRRRGITSWEVLYSAELPPQIQLGDGRTKAATLGSMSYMPPIMGEMLAGLVIRRLAGLEEIPDAPTMRQA